MARTLHPVRAIELTPLGVRRVLACDVSAPARRIVAVVVDEAQHASLIGLDLDDGRLQWTEPLEGVPGESVQVSPDGARAAVSVAGRVAVHAVDTGRRLRSGPTAGPAGALAWRPDGTGLAVAVGGEVELWDVAAEAVTRTGVLRAGRTPTEGVLSVAWAPSGECLAVGTTNPAVYIARVGAASRSLAPLTTAVGWLSWNAAGDLLATGGLGTGGAVTVFAGAAATLDDPFGPPASAVGASDGSILLWQAASGTVDTFTAHPDSAVSQTRWAGDELVTVAGYPDLSVRVWGHSVPAPPHPPTATLTVVASGPQAAAARTLFAFVVRGRSTPAAGRLDDSQRCTFAGLVPGAYRVVADTKADVPWAVEPRAVEVVCHPGETQTVQFRFG